MPAMLIAERNGWIRSTTVLRERMREIHPNYLQSGGYGRTT
jgi:hypothetical protein